MATVKLTKNELKRQKDQLKQYERYLPTLQLKKQQLQTVVSRVEAEKAAREAEYAALTEGVDTWVAVLAENRALPEGGKLESLIRPVRAVRVTENIAGVRVPVFKELLFADPEYDVRAYPLWVDTAVERLRDIARTRVLLDTLREQIDLLQKEFRMTSQRVNLFEKVMIPAARENIKKISIYLGDQQTAAVIRGKIAKKKRAEAIG